MDAKYFCTTVQSELVGLKSRVYDIISTVDSMPGEKKSELQGKIPELHKMVADLSRMVDELKVACPADFSSEKGAIEAKKNELVEKIDFWDSTNIPGGYVGG